MQILRILFLSSLALQPFFSTRAAEPASNRWSEFRNGGRSTINASLPSTWSPESLAWQRELLGYGQSTPIVHNGLVFVTSVNGPMKEECVVTCLDLKNGNELWQFKHQATTKAASNYMASRAAPTPMADDQAVYAFFESGDCLALDHSGKLLWHRSLTSDYGKFDNNHGLGASPTQTDRSFIINVEHRGPSYLIALDKRGGSTQWKTDRASSSSWSSPIVLELNKQMQVIVSSGGKVDGYDASTGKSAWSIGGLDGNSVPSPTPFNDWLLVGARMPEFGSDGDAARSNLCISLTSLASQGVSPQVAWRASKAVSDYASPVVCQGCGYYLNKIGVLYCLDCQTGEANYTERLGTQCWATPIVTEDRVYFFGKDGKTQVIKAGSQFELLSSNMLWQLDSPPKPESYVENNERATGAREGGQESEAGQRTENASRSGSPSAGGRGAGMLAQLMKGDSDGDGQLSAGEIPSEFKSMLSRIDTNQDGALDAPELKAMADSFAARRADSREGARDPIVYGAAAVEGSIVIRTGTRLYCIH